MEECFAKDGYVKDDILSRAQVNNYFNCPLFQALSCLLHVLPDILYAVTLPKREK